MNISDINLSLYTYECIITAITDGDSIWGIIDRGFGDHSLRELRLNRIDAWEIIGHEKNLGYIAKDFVYKHAPVGSKVTIESLGYDNFGRLICEVWIEGEGEWINLNDLLVEQKHAVYKKYRQNPKRMFRKSPYMHN